jgi:hypothetical protein
MRGNRTASAMKKSTNPARTDESGRMMRGK